MTLPEASSARAVAARLGAPGLVAVALIACAAAACLVMLPGLVAAVFVPTPSEASFPADAAKDQSTRLEGFHRQIDGRTMFFVPAKPPPPKPVVEAKAEDTGPPPAPPPPSTYSGPAPIAMVFDTVWFADGQKLKAGDEAKGDLQVVRLEAPWAAVLSWKGVEFTVKVFERDAVVIKAAGQPMAVGTPPEPKPAPAPAPAPAGADDSAAAPPAAASEQPAPSEPSPAEPPSDPESNR